ncbi:hypothetical protein M8C21_027452, partial [Ambrosia artemisiifolia]
DVESNQSIKAIKPCIYPFYLWPNTPPPITLLLSTGLFKKKSRAKMVRGKTQMRRIENATSRQVTFSKRRN